MIPEMNLNTLLSGERPQPTQQIVLFATLNLGILQLLETGLLSATEAVHVFYNADNCLYVRKQIRQKAADRIMSHAVQFPDLFDSLPAQQAQKEFQRELATMRSLCLKLLEGEKLVA